MSSTTVGSHGHAHAAGHAHASGGVGHFINTYVFSRDHMYGNIVAP